jgi:cytidylate kinase
MKKEYDFSKGVRGRFYRPNARFNVPVYLDGKVQQFVERIAERKRTDVTAVVNRLLRSEMELVEAAK